MAAADLQKISISGATLSSLLQRFASSPGDSDGLLFGHLSLLPPPEPSDDVPLDPTSSSSSSSPLMVASISGHLSTGTPLSFHDALGRVDPAVLRSRPPIGWFSSRRRRPKPLRPSMREHAVSLSLQENLALALGTEPPQPLVLILLSLSATDNRAVHTHEYRAFVIRPNGGGIALEPRSIDVVNVGPAFRGQYGSFAPESALPWMPFTGRGEKEREGRESESVDRVREEAGKDQRVLDASVEGFGMERLGVLVGPEAVGYASELEDFYGKMLSKLEGLAMLVDKSSTRVLEQEVRNLKLRSRLAGLE